MCLWYHGHYLPLKYDHGIRIDLPTGSSTIDGRTQGATLPSNARAEPDPYAFDPSLINSRLSNPLHPFSCIIGRRNQQRSEEDAPSSSSARCVVCDVCVITLLMCPPPCACEVGRVSSAWGSRRPSRRTWHLRSPVHPVTPVSHENIYYDPIYDVDRSDMMGPCE
jgi:hypothetical protein